MANRNPRLTFHFNLWPLQFYCFFYVNGAAYTGIGFGFGKSQRWELQ